MNDPAHPSEFLKSEVVEAHGLSVTDAAHALGVTRPAPSALLNQRVHLSPELALRIENACGVPLDTLTRLQNSFDIVQVRTREKEIKISPFQQPPASPRSLP